MIGSMISFLCGAVMCGAGAYLWENQGKKGWAAYYFVSSLPFYAVSAGLFLMDKAS